MLRPHSLSQIVFLSDAGASVIKAKINGPFAFI